MGGAERGGDGGLHVLLGDAHGWRSGGSLFALSSVCSGRAKASKKASLASSISLYLPSSTCQEYF